MSHTVLVDRAGPIVRVRLDRPDKRNAQSLEMWAELLDVGTRLQAEADVRVVVLSGEGHSFSAGIDLTVMRALQSAGRAGVPDVAEIQRSFRWLRDGPFVSIAMVQGYALGAGMQLALACDLRILATDATMALPEVDFGIFPDVGGCVWLPELIGAGRAKELIFTGERISADRALTLGVANHVVAPDDLERTTMELAARIATKPPLGLAGAKAAIAAATRSAEDGFLVSAERVRGCLDSDDFREAGRAVFEKRSPNFTGK